MAIAAALQDVNLASEITAYWDGRAQTYSNGVNGELCDGRYDAWKSVIAEVLPELQPGSSTTAPAARLASTLAPTSASASASTLATAPATAPTPAPTSAPIPAPVSTSASATPLRVCDLGCGPGFFSILFAEMGCRVDAVDASEAMIARAQSNLQKTVPGGDVTFHNCDVLSTSFSDDTFDLCVSRNVTWLMRDPFAAYAEWLRVLKPGGRLLVFDANWYRYLVDADVAAARSADQAGNVLEGWDEDAQASSDEERRCEEIAASLPLTPILRPAWDLETLASLGASDVWADEDVWCRVWTPSEQSYYRATPMFMVAAVK